MERISTSHRLEVETLQREHREEMEGQAEMHAATLDELEQLIAQRDAELELVGRDRDAECEELRGQILQWNDAYNDLNQQMLEQTETHIAAQTENDHQAQRITELEAENA